MLSDNPPYCPFKVTPKQAKAIVKQVITAVESNRVTTYAAATAAANAAEPGRELGQNQLFNVLAMLSALTRAAELGYVSAMVRTEKGPIGSGFWPYIHHLGEATIDEPSAQERWLHDEEKRLQGNCESVLALLNFVVDQIGKGTPPKAPPGKVFAVTCAACDKVIYRSWYSDAKERGRTHTEEQNSKHFTSIALTDDPRPDSQT